MNQGERNLTCQVEDRIIEAIKSLKGEWLQLNAFRFGDHSQDDGYVITGGVDFFFFKTLTKSLGSKYQLHLLTIEQIWEQDVEEQINFDQIEEGEFSELHFFNHTLENVQIEKQNIDRLTCECACMIHFKDKPPILIYPKEKLFGNSMIETDTDRILDIIGTMKLHLSRTI